MRILLLAGSFHSKSRSLALLNAVRELLPGHQCDLPRLDTLPFYCEDLAHDKPAVVRDFIGQVESCEAIIACMPEYNHSLPAVIKNAIDWASRPAFQSPLKNKPVTIITQAVSPVGGARAQAHAKLVFDATLSLIHPCHEMMVTGIDTAIDTNGRVCDAKVLGRLERHVVDFLGFVERVRVAAHS